MATRALLRDQYRRFLAICYEAVKSQPLLFFGFLVVTTAAAITEGLGVGLLIPLMQQSTLSTGGVAPWFDRFLVSGLPADPSSRTAALAAVLAGVIALRGILQVVASYVAITLPRRLQARLSIDTYDTLLDAGLDFFAKADGGILRTLVQDYPLRIASSIKSITDIVASVMLAIIYASLMLSVSWSMTLVAIVLVGFAGGAVKRILTLPLAHNGLALSAYQEQYNTQIYETGLGLKLIRLLGAEALMRQSFQKVVNNYLQRDAQRQLIGEAQSPLITTVGGLFVCGMLIYGSSAASGVDTAHLLVLVLCLYRLTAPVSRILTCFVIIDTNLDAMQRLEGFSAESRASRITDGTRRFDKIQSGIRFEDIKFVYPNSERPALENFDLTVRRGEMIALVGPSGAGKSTVVNMLGRLYDPQKGRIEIDGIDLREYKIASWRRRIAVVTQDITLFNMSVTDNLAFGLSHVTHEQLARAATRAAALEFIEALPEGWDTKLGDRGLRLSGGQQQRLSIARAMLRDPELLILDEATSQLDSLTERTIQEIIASYRHDCSIVVVAHRLSTIVRADRIAVMRGGQIVEFGTHDELASRDSQYRTMLEAQQLEIVPDLAS